MHETTTLQENKIPTAIELRQNNDFLAPVADYAGFRGDRWTPDLGCGLAARNACRAANSDVLGLLDSLAQALTNIVKNVGLAKAKFGEIMVRLTGSDIRGDDADEGAPSDGKMVCHVLISLPNGRPEVQTLSFCQFEDDNVDESVVTRFPYVVVVTDMESPLNKFHEGSTESIGHMTSDDLAVLCARSCQAWVLESMAYEDVAPHRMKVTGGDDAVPVQKVDAKNSKDKAKQKKEKLTPQAKALQNSLKALRDVPQWDPRTPPPPAPHPTKRRRMTTKSKAASAPGAAALPSAASASAVPAVPALPAIVSHVEEAVHEEPSAHMFVGYDDDLAEGTIAESEPEPEEDKEEESGSDIGDDLDDMVDGADGDDLGFAGLAPPPVGHGPPVGLREEMGDAHILAGLEHLADQMLGGDGDGGAAGGAGPSNPFVVYSLQFTVGG